MIDLCCLSASTPLFKRLFPTYPAENDQKQLLYREEQFVILLK